MYINETTIEAAARALHETSETRAGVRRVDRVDFDDLAASERRNFIEDATAALTAAKAAPSEGEWVPHPMIPNARVWEPASGFERDWAGDLIE